MLLATMTMTQVSSPSKVTLTQATESTENCVTIFMYHTEDSYKDTILSNLTDYSANGETDDLVLVECSNAEQMAQRLVYGEFQTCDYLEVIASSGDVDRVDIFTFSTFKLSDIEQATLGTQAYNIRQELKTLGADDDTVSDIRLFFPSHENHLPSVGFFSPTPDHSLIAIPRDQESEKTFAVPLTRDYDESTFSQHITTEILSLSGSWKLMKTSPIKDIETFDSGTGTFDVGIRFVRSFGRFASLHNPAEISLPSNKRHLPSALSCSPASSSPSSSQKMADSLFPKSFRYEPSINTSDKQGNIAGRELLKLLIRRIWHDLLRLPKLIWEDIEDTFDETVDVLTQEAVGDNSWIQVIRPSATDEDSDQNKEFDLERAVAEIEPFMDNPNKLPPVGVWTHFVKGIFSYADGDIEFNNSRERLFGDENRVVLDRNILISDEDLPLDVIFENETDEENADQFDLAEAMPDEKNDESTDEENADQFDLDEAMSDEKNDESTDEENLVENNKVRKFLLTSIRDTFKSQVTAAGARRNQNLIAIKNFTKSEVHFSTKVNASVKICLAFAIFLFLVTTTSFTGLHSHLDISDSLGAAWRMRVFILITAIVVFLVGLIHLPDKSNNVQDFLLKLSLSVFVPAIILIVFADPISNETLPGEVSSTIGCLMVIGLCIFTFLSMKMPISDGSRHLNYALKKLSGYLLWIYALIMTVVYLNDRGTSFVTEEIDHFLMILGFTFSFVLYFTAGIILSIVRIRTTYKRESEEETYRGLIEAAKSSIYKHRFQEQLLNDWYPTERSLDSLIRFPAGKLQLSSNPAFGLTNLENSLRKFKISKFMLSESSQRTYAEENPSLPPRGWLYMQYQQATSKLLKSQMFEPTEDNQPESGSDTTSLAEGISGESSSLRWLLAHNLRLGTFDKELLESYQGLLNVDIDESLFESYFSDEEIDLRAYFNDLLPVSPVSVPRTVFLNTRAQMLQISSEPMKSCIWWPRLAPPPSDFIGEVHYVDSALQNDDLQLQSLRIDVSTFFSMRDLEVMVTLDAPYTPDDPDDPDIVLG